MTGNETGVHCKTTFKTSRRQMMLGLCRSSSRYSQCVQGCLVWTICARARLEALTEANEQDLAELQRLKSHDAASEWHLRSTGEWILKRELIGGCQASWWPELFLKAVVTMKAVQCLLQAPMFWPDLRKILPIWGQDVMKWSSGRFMACSDCSNWGPGEILAVEFFCEIRSPEGGHANPVGLSQTRSPNPNAEMKKAIWEEWKALKCHLQHQGLISRAFVGICTACALFPFWGWSTFSTNATVLSAHAMAWAGIMLQCASHHHIASSLIWLRTCDTCDTSVLSLHCSCVLKAPLMYLGLVPSVLEGLQLRPKHGDVHRLLEWMTMSPSRRTKAVVLHFVQNHSTLVSNIFKHYQTVFQIEKTSKYDTFWWHSVQRSPSMPGPLSAGYDSHVVLLRTSRSGKAGISSGFKLWSSRLLHALLGREPWTPIHKSPSAEWLNAERLSRTKSREAAKQSSTHWGWCRRPSMLWCVHQVLGIGSYWTISTSQRSLTHLCVYL